MRDALGRPDVRIAALLGICAALGYLPFYHGYLKGTDEVGVFEITQALFQDGSLAIPPITHTAPGPDGRSYSFFNVGQPILALPFYAMGRLAEVALPTAAVRALAGTQIEQGPIRWGGSVEIFFVGLYAPVATGVLVALFFLFERRLGVSRRHALLSAILLATATYVAMMSLFFLRHTTEAIAILGALYCLYDWRETASHRSAALGSLLGSFTLLVREPSAIAGVSLAAYALWVLRKTRGTALARALAALALPCVGVLALHMAANHARWGTWLASPMLAQSEGFSTPFYVGAWGLLLSPGSSLFVYSPLLLLAPWTVPPFWRAHRAECATVLGICVSLLLLSSKFDLWTGLWSSPGPRMLFAAVPLLMLPLGCWLDAGLGRAQWGCVVLLAAAGAGVQLLLMLASWPVVIDAMDYHRFDPGKAFVFLPQYSPLIGSARVIADGHVDAWLWRLWTGWPGQPGSALAPLVMLGIWGLVFAGARARLWRAVRAPALGCDPAPDRERSAA